MIDSRYPINRPHSKLRRQFGKRFVAFKRRQGDLGFEGGDVVSSESFHGCSPSLTPGGVGYLSRDGTYRGVLFGGATSAGTGPGRPGENR